MNIGNILEYSRRFSYRYKKSYRMCSYHFSVILGEMMKVVRCNHLKVWMCTVVD